MNFTVIHANGLEEDFEGEDVKYSVNEHGVLLVREGDSKTHFSPSGWLRVVDESPKKAPRSGFAIL